MMNIINVVEGITIINYAKQKLLLKATKGEQV